MELEGPLTILRQNRFSGQSSRRPTLNEPAQPSRKDARPIWDFPLEQQAEQWQSRMGGPAFRFKQVRQWVYGKGATEPDEMANLPKAMKDKMALEMPPLLAFDTALKASDQSADKYLFRCRDGAKLESVMLRSGSRRTICLSTQVGCALACRFCHTGLAGFKRNLSTGEMVEQVLRISRLEEQRISNLVVMGMGEPMQNYDALMAALRQINAAEGLGIGARHITISTSGIRGGVRRLASEPEQWGLAVSLHAPNDDLRSDLMPINRKVPLSELMDEIDEYIEKTGRRVSFEYICLGDTNTSTELARELLHLLRGRLCHVNLIPYNPVPTLPFSATPMTQIQNFMGILNDGGIPCTIRMEKGQDILAACGQLAHRDVEKRA